MAFAASPSLTYGAKPRRSWKRLLLKASLFLVVLLVILAAVAAYLLWCILGEIPFSTRSANAVVSQVMNHTLTPNAVGIVTLPSSLASNSENGNVYVTIDSAGTTWILFPTWRGKGDNIAGYLYHNVPANGAQPAQITVTGPGLMSPFAEPLPYTVDRQIDANWFHVSWSMD